MENSNKGLQERIEQLENRVELLERKLQENSGSPIEIETSETGRPKENRQSPGEMPGWPSGHFTLGEEWLNRIGIGLLLIGIAFLFKYSVDQGWLIPQVRSAIGLGIGLILLGSGFRMDANTGPMKQVLVGGGIAAFYITGFATFQLYSFLPSAVVWTFMITVTFISFILSVRQNEPVLSVVGTCGALGTPFMLYSGEGSVIMLVLYLTLVLTAAAGIYMSKAWKMLHWSIAAGGCAVLAVGTFHTIIGDEPIRYVEQWALQGGVIIWLFSSWFVPVGRELLSKRNPQRWSAPEERMTDLVPDSHRVHSPASNVHLLSFLIPLFVLVLSLGIWELSMNQAGAGSMMLAAFAFLIYWPVKKEGLPKLASTHALLGLIMLTIGLFLLLEGDVLIMILMAETVALRYVAYQTDDRKMSMGSHILFGIVIFWLFNILRLGEFSGSFLLNSEALSQLTVIAAGGLLIPRWLKDRNIRDIYQLSCHIMFLFWLYQKFTIIENGQAWTTVAWGVYAIFLLIPGITNNIRAYRFAGMATIFVVVGKLFLVDLSTLEAIWRILLFMGFGTIFLFLGYYWQSSWRNRSRKR